MQLSFSFMAHFIPGLVLLAFLLSISACNKAPPAEKKTRYRIESVGIEIPKLKGWTQDREVKLQRQDMGGTVFRLVRENAVSGSPRIDVIVEDSQTPSPNLESFLEKNLREMNKLAEAGQISITEIIKEPAQLGPRRAFKVRHEYTIGGSSAVAITQTALFVIIDGRGVAINAAGRTELFHPLAQNILDIFADISTLTGKHTVRFNRPKPMDPGTPLSTPKKEATEKSLTEPIDLGKIGTK